MSRVTWIQSQVVSYQRLKKWYLMPPCLTLSIIRYRSRVTWSNPAKGVSPSPITWCSSYRKGSLRFAFDNSRQLYLLILWPPSSPDHKAFNYSIWGVLENKTNTTSHPNIGSLKTAIEEKWNKMSEEFILKAWKLFRRRVDTIIEKRMVAILSKFTVLCLFSYFVYFLELKLILFYNRVKNAASNLEQILAATPHKTSTIRPPASYLENYPS